MGTILKIWAPFIPTYGHTVRIVRFNQYAIIYQINSTDCSCLNNLTKQTLAYFLRTYLPYIEWMKLSLKTYWYTIYVGRWVGRSSQK